MQTFSGLDNYKYGFSKPENYVFKSKKGLDERVVANISWHKNEPDWMRQFRLKSYQIFLNKTLPIWGGDLSHINFQDIFYYIKPTKDKAASWEELPPEIKDTYDRIGMPEAEKKFLAGVSAQYESEVVYKSIQKTLSQKGVVFLDMDSGLREYPELVKKYFGTIIPPGDNKFSALNSAVWSGGSFIYVPKGVRVELPLQAYFRINAANMGQFERTLIIADEGSYVHYVEGCFPAGEQISIGDQWVNIESIKPKDLVADDQGKLRRVKSVMTRPYTGDLIEVTPISAYNKFSLTPEHPVLAIKRREVLVKRKQRKNWQREVNSKILLNVKPKYLPARELEVGDFIIYPKIKTTANDLWSRETMRLLGYYLAEGSAYIHKQLKMHIVSFSLGENETEIIDEVTQLITKTTGKKPMKIWDKKKHGMEIRVYSKELYELCLKTCGKGAATKKLSKEIMEVSDDHVEQLLQTYFLGDGNICKKGSSVMCRAATVSEQLARQLQELLARLGMYASIFIRKGGKDVIAGRVITRKDQFIIVYTKNKRIGEVRESHDYFIVPVKLIRKIPYTGFVFNMEVADTNSYLVRGFAVHNCTAPIYTTDSLHSAVVEIIVKKGARVRYTTIQNWSTNVYNLVTKRMRVEEEGIGEWVDGNLGSKLTMKYPSVYLVGRKARGEVLSIAYAGPGQHQDAGGKAIHLASETTSRITSKSISKGGGRTSYRGLLHVIPSAKNVKSKVVCDALLLDETSRSDTYPTMKIHSQDVQIEHEATVSKIGEEQLFYLQSRGLTKELAEAMIVNGFIEPIVKELPLEYAVEMNRLIELQMEGSVG